MMVVRPLVTNTNKAKAKVWEDVHKKCPNKNNGESDPRQRFKMQKGTTTNDSTSREATFVNSEGVISTLHYGYEHNKVKHTNASKYEDVVVIKFLDDKEKTYPDATKGKCTRNRIARNVFKLKGKGEIIDRVIGIVDMAFGVKDILLELGILPDGQSEQFEEVLNGIGRNYAAIEEVGYKVDRNFSAIKAVFEVVSKILSNIEGTRIEMRQGFKYILKSIEEIKVEDKISSLATFMNDFSKDVDELNKLSPSVHASELERSGGVLDKIKRSIRSDGILHGNLYHIINEHLAIPKDADDNMAFLAFHLLYYGVQTYVSEMFFVIDQYSFLADYYYKKGDLVKCNNQLDLLVLSFNDFRTSLLSDHNKTRLIDKTIDIIIEMSGLIYIRNKRPEVFDILEKRMTSLRTVKEHLKEMVLPIVTDQPEIITRKPDYSKSNITTPIGNWINGVTVSYAIQYKNNNSYSRIGEWSEPFRVDYKANPILKVPVDPKRRTRLIYRKFKNDNPELVGAIEDKNQIFFRDISRDLYDAAMSSNEEIGENDAQVFISNGGNLNDSFDDGRRAIHAAAWRGNIKIAIKFLNRNPSYINERDVNGYTPIYIAAEAGYEDFVNFSISRGADVNVKTDFNQYSPLHIAAYKGDIPTIEVLLQSNKIDTNSRDMRGFTPLHTAVFGGTYAVNTLLLNNNTDINARSLEGLTPLQIASINGFDDVIDIFMTNKKNNLNSVANGNLTALHFASSLGNTKVVRYLVLGKDIDLNLKSDDGWTALHYATFLKKEDTALELLKVQSTDVNIKGKRKITPLHVATVTEQKNVITNLLIKGALIEERTQDGLTALHLASKLNRYKIISLLIENGANIDAKTPKGLTSLNLAAIYGHAKCVFILLDKGANYKSFNNKGQLPIHEAILHGQHKVTLLLIYHDPSLVQQENQNSEYPLHLAAQKNYVRILSLLASKMSNLNIRTTSGETPLYYAVRSGSIDAIEFLAKSGADLNVKNYSGDAPIHWAAANNNSECINCLATNGADLNIKNSSGSAPLHLAAKSNFLEVIKSLADHGADLNTRDDSYYAALHWAAKENHSDAIKCLAKNGANLNIKDRNGWTSLHWTSNDGFLQATKSLVLSLADINAKDDINNTPLHLAVQNERIDIVKYLIENKANVNAINKLGFYGGTPLHYAASKGSLIISQYLINNGANVNVRDISGTTPLHCAVAVSKSLDMVKLLIKNKTIIDPRGMDGQTPLFSSAVDCNFEIAKYLVQNGANRYARDDYGNTPAEHLVKKIMPYISSQDSRTCYHNMVQYLTYGYKSETTINRRKKRNSSPNKNIPFYFSKYLHNHKSLQSIADRSRIDIKTISKATTNNVDIDIFGHKVYNFVNPTTLELKAKSDQATKHLTYDKANINKNTQNTSRFNNDLCSNNLALAYFLFQTFLDKKYPYPKDCSAPPDQILASALLITEQFENILTKTANQCGIILKDVCFYKLYKDVGFYLRNEKYSQVPSALYLFATEYYPEHKDFLNTLKFNIKIMLNTPK